MRFVDFIIKEMREHPELFQIGPHHLIYEKGKRVCRIWTADGVSFAQIANGPKVFSFLDKIKFWNKYRKFMQTELVKRYSADLEPADASKP